MSTYSDVRDMTAKQSPGGGGMVILHAFICGHKSSSTGAMFRRVAGLGRVPYRCAACNAKDKP